ncbi:MAG: CDP-diacylglycerol--glycerol-3-phosphate 3-phosphatidyltransferase [Ruminococcaceae bacterium]|nr:CDP-diacylglycerol--glycerol-3-phosphate 3-phosphatidyltransferase [Oscillospiraceae bacterium]
MNLPNKLTVLRLILVPFILVVMLLPYTWYNNLIAAFIFGAASFTDMLDGKIARKRGLVTDFGKFLDPLADKFMVIAAIFGVVCRYRADNDIMFWVFMIMLMITVFRELAVASIRLITAKKSGVVVAADKLGKIKTVVQIACIELALLEPVVYDNILARIDPTYFFGGFYVLTLVTAALAILFTIWSGINYIVTYWKYMDPEK